MAGIGEYMDWPRIEAVIYGEEAAPADVMGPRITKDGVLIQGFFPGAKAAAIQSGRKKYPMELQDENGYFAALLPLRKIPDYTFEVSFADKKRNFADAYAFPGRITEEEEKEFLAGVWYDAYKKLGAHPSESGKVKGTCFAVWAPNARRVSVVGDFNDWDGRVLPMHRHPMSGIFELFIPGVGEGTIYKYEIITGDGERLLKADPYAFCTEDQGRPEQEEENGRFSICDASVVADLEKWTWKDEEYMDRRTKKSVHRCPISIYETALTDWEDASLLAAFAKECGYTHVELHPVMEYLDEKTGGYSTFAYFAPSSRFGGPEAFQKLVDTLHAENIGVILDWTPAQFPDYASGLSMFDGTPLYEIPDPAFQKHPMWGTFLYNYESPIVKEFLISNACFFMETYHADGLRFDDVDAMLYLDYGRKAGEYQTNIFGSNENLWAVEFLKHLNSIVKKRNPGTLLIAQEDGLWPELTDSVENDHLGFDYKWSGGWTADLLDYLSVDPILRSGHHDQLTLSSLYAYSEEYILTLGTRDVKDEEAFLSRIWGSREQKEAQRRAAYAYMCTHPGCKMTALSKNAPKELKTLLKDLNDLYLSHPALYEMDDDYEGFEWIQLMKYEENVLAFLRRGEKEEDSVLVLCNFSAVPYEKYQVGVPFYGRYKELLNTDDKKYQGQGKTNPRAKTARQKVCDERDYSISVYLPPLSVLIFSCTPLPEPERKVKASQEGKEGAA